MTLNPAWLDDFLVLAESGNISRAADERHITPPSVKIDVAWSESIIDE